MPGSPFGIGAEMAAEEFRYGIRVQLTSGDTEASRQLLGGLEHIVGYGYGSLHEGYGITRVIPCQGDPLEVVPWR